MGLSAYELQRKGAGFLLGNSSLDRKRIEKMYEEGEQIFITNNPRIIAALKLLGAYSIEINKIKGIELFLIA